jgi:hypothetical protein
VKKTFEQEHAEGGGRAAARPLFHPRAFLCGFAGVRNVFLRLCSFMAGLSEDETMGHGSLKGQFSRKVAKPPRRLQM